MISAVNSGCRRGDRCTGLRPRVMEGRSHQPCAEGFSRLPEKAAAAIVEFVTGVLADNPYRLSKPLTNELLGCAPHAAVTTVCCSPSTSKSTPCTSTASNTDPTSTSLANHSKSRGRMCRRRPPSPAWIDGRSYRPFVNARGTPRRMTSTWTFPARFREVCVRARNSQLTRRPTVPNGLVANRVPVQPCQKVPETESPIRPYQF